MGRVWVHLKLNGWVRMGAHIYYTMASRAPGRLTALAKLRPGLRTPENRPRLTIWCFYDRTMTWNKILIFPISTTNFRVDTNGCRQSLDIDGWIHVGTPFENGLADVTGCSQIGDVPFSDTNWILQLQEVRKETLLWEEIGYSMDLQHICSLWLQPRIRFANHLMVIMCLTLYWCSLHSNDLGTFTPPLRLRPIQANVINMFYDRPLVCEIQLYNEDMWREIFMLNHNLRRSSGRKVKVLRLKQLVKLCSKYGLYEGWGLNKNRTFTRIHMWFPNYEFICLF
jgi:hypothetical protein